MTLKAYASIIAGTFTALVLSDAPRSPSPPKFDWKSIQPAPDLQYQPCLDKFQCARLELPMDWHDPSNNKTVAVAIIKLGVAKNDPSSFAGSVILNPGGPGSSGVEFLPAAAELLQSIVDIPGKRHYEIVSFDPRGIGETTPTVDCFPSGPLGRTGWLLETLAAGTLDLNDQALIYTLGAAKNQFQRCQAAAGDILPFVNTPSVARDMVAMVDKMGELQCKESGCNSTVSDLPRLQYIGISYGTVLGNYFASMFPGRVGRVILDGVWDANDYAKGPLGLRNTVDTDQMMDIFFEGCFKVGLQRCKLRQPQDTSSKDISSRTWSWIQALDMEPITAVTDGGPSLTLRSGDIRTILFHGLYSAGVSFPAMSTALSNAIVDGNNSALINIATSTYGLPSFKDACTTPSRATLMEGRDAILCSDAEDVTDKDLAYWRDYLQKQLSISKVAAAAWAAIRTPCSAWKIRANWVFRGPFTSPQPSKNVSNPERGRPAAPLLMSSNRYDPATPLRDARSVAKAHPNAGVLIQESMGHGLIGSLLISNCSRQVISDYFNKGAVPDGEAVCEGVRDPWQPNGPTSTETDNSF